MAELQFPDIVGQYQQGYDRGRGQLASKLAGQAYSAQGADRQSALSQLAGVDPRTAMEMSDRFQQQDQAQQAQSQAQTVDHAKKINGAANFVLQAVQSKDPARIQGAYQAVRPYLAEVTGKEPPPQWDDSMLPGLYQTISATGGAAQQKGTVVAPGGALVDSATGQQMFSNPAAPANAQLVNVPTGDGGTTQMLFDPRTRQLTQPNFGGGQGQPPAQPQGGMQTKLAPVGSGVVDQANAFLAQGYPAEQAASMAAGANASSAVHLGLDPATGQFKDVSDGSAQIPQGQGAPQGMAPQGAPQMAPQGMAGQAPAHGMGYTPPKDKGNAPSGYRFAADGKSLEAIPGGPADRSTAADQGLSSDALTNAAWQDILTGNSGIRGYGKEAVAQRAQIANMKADIAKQAGVSPQELSTTAGRNKALQSSLTNLQKQSDIMRKSEMGFQNNMDQALALSAKIDRSGMPLVNKWLLGGRAAMGDPDVVALDAAITTAATDYARIMSGQSGAGGTPISTADEAKRLIRKELSDKQFSAVAEVLHNDINGQQQAMDSQRQTILSNMQQFGTPAPSASHATAPSASTGKMLRYNPATGKIE